MKRTQLQKRQYDLVGHLQTIVHSLQHTDSQSVTSFDAQVLLQIDVLRQLIVDTKKDY